MEIDTVDGPRVAVLKRLIAEAGTAQVARPVSDLARQHAADLLTQGARVDAARFAREVTILAKASAALVDYRRRCSR